MRFAICNETFEGWDHARICCFVAETGYTGLELAPFMFADRITKVTDRERRDIRREAEAAGLTIVGLHWLLARTEGFQLTSPDPEIRRKTAEYLVELARCCRDVGGDVLVFGSPAQRRMPPGCTRSEARNFAIDTLEKALGGIARCNVKLCLEPLSPTETDFLNTCAEAAEIMDFFRSPNLALHLDVKAMASEGTSTPELIRCFGSRTGHFHANDPNKRGPGFGDTDFVPIFQALEDVDYTRWVSVEVFDYSPDPETIARKSLQYMKRCLESVNPSQ
jgi:sugar phosphate isomerase/epimerase